MLAYRLGASARRVAVAGLHVAERSSGSRADEAGRLHADADAVDVRPLHADVGRLRAVLGVLGREPDLGVEEALGDRNGRA